jgi:hypothetical protein
MLHRTPLEVNVCRKERGMANTKNHQDPEYVEWRNELDCLKQKIAKRGDHDLRTFEEIGVPRATMLELLALTASRTGGMIQIMRNRRGKLKSLAARMESLSSNLDEALCDPLMRMPFWVYYEGCGSLLAMKEPKAWTWKDADPSAFLGPSSMRALAKMFQREARKFSLFLRKYGRADSQQRVGLLLLRVYQLRLMHEGDELGAGRHFVKLTPRRGPDHLDALARLLTDAFEAAGVNKSGKPRRASRPDARPRPDEYFSAEGLSQVWKRIAYRMLAIWLKNAGVLEKSPPEQALAATLPIRTPLLGRPSRDTVSSDTSRQ